MQLWRLRGDSGALGPQLACRRRLALCQRRQLVGGAGAGLGRAPLAEPKVEERQEVARLRVCDVVIQPARDERERESGGGSEGCAAARTWAHAAAAAAQARLQAARDPSCPTHQAQKPVAGGSGKLLTKPLTRAGSRPSWSDRPAHSGPSGFSSSAAGAAPSGAGACAAAGGGASAAAASRAAAERCGSRVASGGAGGAAAGRRERRRTREPVRSDLQRSPGIFQHTRAVAERASVHRRSVCAAFSGARSPASRSAPWDLRMAMAQ